MLTSKRSTKFSPVSDCTLVVVAPMSLSLAPSALGSRTRRTYSSDPSELVMKLRSSGPRRDDCRVVFSSRISSRSLRNPPKEIRRWCPESTRPLLSSSKGLPGSLTLSRLMLGACRQEKPPLTSVYSTPSCFKTRIMSWRIKGNGLLLVVETEKRPLR